MKIFKAIVCAILTAAMTLAAAGCEKKNEKVVLEWWYRGNGVQPDTQLVQDTLNEKLAQYPGMENVEVHMNCYAAADYSTAVTLAMTAGKQMDIINTVGLDFSDLCRDGALISLDGYLDEMPELKQELPDWMWDIASFDGQVHMVPNYQRAASQVYLTTPKKYVDCFAGFDQLAELAGDPKSSVRALADSFEQYLLAVRKAFPGEQKYLTPFAKPFTNTEGFKDFGDDVVSDIRYFHEAKTLEHVYLTEKAQEAYAVTADWFTKGYIHPDILTVDFYANYENANMQNPVSHIFTFVNAIGDAELVSKQYTDVYGFETVAVPVKDTYYIQNKWGAGGNGVSASCKNPKEAMRFIELLNTEEGKDVYNLTVYGIEGKHYEKLDDSHIKTLEYDSSQGGGSTSYAAMKWIIGNTFNAYLNQGCVDGENEITLALNESGDTIKSNLIGFHTDTSNIETQTSQLASITTEYSEALMYGVKGSGWETYFKEFQDKLALAGLEQVKTELAEQINTFLKERG